MGKWSWKAFLEEILGIAPQVMVDVATDKQAFGSDSHIAAATTATMQASQLAQTIDPNDTQTIAAATAVTEGVIQGLVKPTPVPPAAA